MRVLTVSHFFEAHRGGIEIVAGEISAALAQRGIAAHWAAADLDPLPDRPGVHPVALAAIDPLEKTAGLPLPLPKFGAMAQLNAAVRSADGVIIHDALYVTSLLAAIFAWRHRKPWILIQHIGAIPYSSPLLRLLLGLANRTVTRWMLRAAPQVVFISDTVRRHFASAAYKASPKLLFNGVDTTLFRAAAAPDEPESSNSAAQGKVPRNRILFVGRFVERKGLAIIRELAQLRPDLDILMAGQGPIDPRSWQLANVQVLGTRTRAELAELYRSCTALLLPSVGEGYPLVVQEAMASGLPVVCGTESANADPGAAAFLIGVEVDLQQPALTAQAAAAALDIAVQRDRAAMSAYARDCYDWGRNADWLAGRLDELAKA